MKLFHPTVLEKILIAACFVSLSACEVGKDYGFPEQKLPADWQSKHGDARAQIDQNWWKNFNDPILNQLIDQASDQNFDLKIATARIAQSRASVASASAALLPQGNLQGQATRQDNRQALPGGPSNPSYKLLKKPYNIYQTGFDASWELDLFGGNRRAEEAATASLQASEASRDDVLVSLRGDVARLYLQIRHDQEQMRILNHRIAAYQKTLVISRERAAIGQVAHLEVTQAEAALNKEIENLPPLRSRIAQNEYSLDVLLGAQAGTVHTVVATPAALPALPENLMVATPAAVIANRPDLRIAERKLAAATAQQGVALARFFPDISLTGFFGALNTTTDKLITGSSQSWSAGGNVIWPILSYGTLSANLDAADAGQQEALATYQKTVLAALADVETRLNAYDEQEKTERATALEADQNQRALKIAHERYDSGTTSYLDVLDAERLYDSTAQRLIDARADRAQDLVALYKSLGGGWVSL